MNKTLVILRREYITRVRTKAFVIGTLLTPILMLVLTILPGFLATRGGGERHVTVLDQSGDPELFGSIKKEIDGTPEGGEGDRRRGTRFVVTRVVVPTNANVDTLAEEYKTQVQKDSNAAYLILRPGVMNSVEPEYYAKNTSDFSISAVGRAVSDGIRHRRLLLGGLTEDEVTASMKSVGMKKLSVDEAGQTKEESGLPGFIIAFVMLFFIYMTILMHGITVMRGVMEEKQSRIVEVIASSVRPTQMMMGKLVGIGLVGLTQYAIWVGSAAALTVVGASMVATQGIKIPTIPMKSAHLLRRILRPGLLPVRNPVCNGGRNMRNRRRGPAGPDAGYDDHRRSDAVLPDGHEQPQQRGISCALAGSVLCADADDDANRIGWPADLADSAVDGWNGGDNTDRGLGGGENLSSWHSDVRQTPNYHRTRTLAPLHIKSYPRMTRITLIHNENT